jgi:mRNA interferase MazF
VSTSKPYVPDRGDLIWLNFNPQAGREQGGHRPALVVSPKTYNQKVGLALCCPVTSQVKGYPFEVVLPKGLPVLGAVLSDHIKSLDWRSRQAEFKGRAPKAVVNEVLEKIGTLLSVG